MTTKEVLIQKQRELNAWNEELKRCDQHRLDVMSQVLKAQGAVEVLTAMVKAEEQSAQAEISEETKPEEEKPAETTDSSNPS